MRVYGQAQYEATLFEVGSQTLARPELVYDYMKDTADLTVRLGLESA